MLANHIIENYVEQLVGCNDPLVIREILISMQRLARRDALTEAAQKVSGDYSCGTYYERSCLARKISSLG